MTNHNGQSAGRSLAFTFSTGSLYSYSIERCFDFSAQAGFDGIELMVDHRFDTRQPAYLRRLMDDYQLPIHVVHSPFSPSIQDWPHDEVGRIKQSVKLAEAIGASVVVHHLPFRVGVLFAQIASKRVIWPWPFYNEHKPYIEWLQGEYAQVQAETDVKLCIENMPARKFLGRNTDPAKWNQNDEIMQFPNITMDTTHLGTWAIDPVATFKRWGERVKHIHLSNFDGREHRRPEAGQLDLATLLGNVASSSYPGVVTLELHPDALDAGAPDEVIIGHMAGSVAWCKRAAGVAVTTETVKSAMPV